MLYEQLGASYLSERKSPDLLDGKFDCFLRWEVLDDRSLSDDGGDLRYVLASLPVAEGIEVA